MNAGVTIVFNGVRIETSGDVNSGMGMAGLIARLIYMHDLNNAGMSDMQIGPELKKMLDHKYAAPVVPTPKPNTRDGATRKTWGT